MTGLAEIEKAMLARLDAAGTADVLGYKYRTLESYPEEFDAYLGTKLKGDRIWPAAWVVFGGWRRPVDVGSSLQADAVFMLVVAAKNLRNETAQRHGGGPGEVGSYQLLIDAAGLLHGQHLGLDMGALQLGACRSVRPSEAIKNLQVSMFALEFTTRLPIDVAGFPARELTDFSTFNANWDVAPFGEVDADPNAPGVQLPADDKAAATDRVELPQ